jgi:outer membrane receptor for ferrienterochelin and colicins
MKKTILYFFLLSFSYSFSQKELEEVKIKGQKKAIFKSLKGTSNTTLVSSEELLKAACCNLAESFETNPSIDVNFSDALTGTKQIKMLGLTSPYIMITEENIPSVRGASQAYGMSFTPGTWVESIQITKGTGSVVNGYESISGQINTELLKPLLDIPFFLNAYADNSSRFEINTHFNEKLDKNWATSLLIHGNGRFGHHDNNNDGFLDNPQGKQLNISNRWQYANQETGWVSFLNARFMRDEKLSGEVHFDPDRDKLTTNHWGSEITTERLDLASKIGYVFKDMPFQSIGFQNAFTHHNQQSYYGLNQYDIKQQSFYSNLIFSSIINNTKHKFSTGLNFAVDNYSEFVNLADVSRIDSSIGTYFEYTYDDNDNFSYILGGRIDNHNRLGIFITPRLHMRYNPWENGVVRISAGRGKRAANIYAENQTLFASSRQFSVLDTDGKVYGLNPEIAWNYGVSFTQKFELFSKNAEVSLDFYRTDFRNQAVVDIMNSPQQALFYNLTGSSFANSLQLDFNVELKKHLNIRTAYKYYNIATDYLSGTFQRPLQAKHRVFGNVEYKTHIKEKGQQWRFDFTANWLGRQQLPYTASNPVEDRLSEFSSSFAVMNFQVTRTFSGTFEMYLGGENIGNYRQDKAILGSSNPFGRNFDASIVYAPIFGQMIYTGIRFKIR